MFNIFSKKKTSDKDLLEIKEIISNELNNFTLKNDYEVDKVRYETQLKNIKKLNTKIEKDNNILNEQLSQALKNNELLINNIQKSPIKIIPLKLKGRITKKSDSEIFASILNNSITNFNNLKSK